MLSRVNPDKLITTPDKILKKDKDLLKGSRPFLRRLKEQLEAQESLSKTKSNKDRLRKQADVKAIETELDIIKEYLTKNNSGRNVELMKKRREQLMKLAKEIV